DEILSRRGSHRHMVITRFKPLDRCTFSSSNQAFNLEPGLNIIKAEVHRKFHTTGRRHDIPRLLPLSGNATFEAEPRGAPRPSPGVPACDSIKLGALAHRLKGHGFTSSWCTRVWRYHPLRDQHVPGVSDQGAG